jgi:hypothetical protein
MNLEHGIKSVMKVQIENGSVTEIILKRKNLKCDYCPNVKEFKNEAAFDQHMDVLHRDIRCSHLNGTPVTPTASPSRTSQTRTLKGMALRSAVGGGGGGGGEGGLSSASMLNRHQKHGEEVKVQTTERKLEDCLTYMNLISMNTIDHKDRGTATTEIEISTSGDLLR